MPGPFRTHRAGATGLSPWCVAHLPDLVHVKLIYPVRRLHRQSEEDPGVHLRELWKAESRHRECSLSSCPFAPPPSQFSGGSSCIPRETPSPRRVVLGRPERGLARPRSLDRRETHCTRSALLGMLLRGEMGGRTAVYERVAWSKGPSDPARVVPPCDVCKADGACEHVQAHH